MLSLGRNDKTRKEMSVFRNGRFIADDVNRMTGEGKSSDVTEESQGATDPAFTHLPLSG